MPNTTSTLFELLDTQSSNLFDEYGFAVHCPMVLIALSKMGASNQQLRDYYSSWKMENPSLGKLSRQPHSGSEINIDNWQYALHQVNQFGQLQNFFQGWIKQSTADVVMFNVLSRIPIAPASVAFHGLIRLAYGLEADHSGEIAAGLAALVVSNFAIELNQSADRPQAESVAQGLTHLSNSLPNFETPAVNITARIRAVIADTRYAGNLPFMPANAFDQMAGCAIALYRQTSNFTALHMVTALHAARVIFARLPKETVAQFLPALWTAYCAAYVSIGAPSINAIIGEPGTQLPWEQLFARACNSTQDHLIKMIYSCRQEYLCTDSPNLQRLYLASANAILAS